MRRKHDAEGVKQCSPFLFPWTTLWSLLSVFRLRILSLYLPLSTTNSFLLVWIGLRYAAGMTGWLAVASHLCSPYIAVSLHCAAVVRPWTRFQVRNEDIIGTGWRPRLLQPSVRLGHSLGLLCWGKFTVYVLKCAELVVHHKTDTIKFQAGPSGELATPPIPSRDQKAMTSKYNNIRNNDFPHSSPSLSFIDSLLFLLQRCCNVPFSYSSAQSPHHSSEIVVDDSHHFQIERTRNELQNHHLLPCPWGNSILPGTRIERHERENTHFKLRYKSLKIESSRLSTRLCYKFRRMETPGAVPGGWL